MSFTTHNLLLALSFAINIQLQMKIAKPKMCCNACLMNIILIDLNSSIQYMHIS
jgi:hypothetical protein